MQGNRFTLSLGLATSEKKKRATNQRRARDIRAVKAVPCDTPLHSDAMRAPGLSFFQEMGRKEGRAARKANKYQEKERENKSQEEAKRKSGEARVSLPAAGDFRPAAWASTRQLAPISSCYQLPFYIGGWDGGAARIFAPRNNGNELACGNAGYIPYGRGRRGRMCNA